MPRLIARCTTSVSPSTLAFDERVRPQRVDDGARDERQVREREPFARPPLRPRLAPHGFDRRVVGARRRTSVCADVCFDASSTTAARLRTLLNGTTSSPRAGRAPASSTSSRVTRPLAPVPAICAGSMPELGGGPPRRRARRTPPPAVGGAPARAAPRWCHSPVVRVGRILRRGPTAAPAWCAARVVRGYARCACSNGTTRSISARRSTICAGRTSRASSTTARSRCASRAGSFFQISGAGHEALLLGLARYLRPGLRLVLPLLPRPGARARARRHAARDPAAGGRLGRRSRVGRPADAVPLGREGAEHRDAVVVHGQPVPARGRVRGSGALHQPPAATPGLRRARRRAHLRVARRRRDVRRRVLGVAEHRVPAAPPGALRRRRQRLRDLGAVDRPGTGADLGDGARHPRAARREDGRPRLLRGARARAPTRSRTCAPAPARASSTRW